MELKIILGTEIISKFGKITQLMMANRSKHPKLGSFNTKMSKYFTKMKGIMHLDFVNRPTSDEESKQDIKHEKGNAAIHIRRCVTGLWMDSTEYQ